MRRKDIDVAKNPRPDLITHEVENCPFAERHVRIHRSWRSVLPQIVLAIVIGLVVFVISSDTGFCWVTVDFSSLGLGGPFTLHLAPLIVAVLIARPIFLMKDCRHELRCTELRSIHGRVSFRQTRIDITFQDILGARVSQSIPDRLLNVGDIIVWTASAARPEIVMRGIGNPNHYCGLIVHRIREANNDTR